MKKPEVTYVIPIITDVFISRLLFSLYKFSPPNSFKVVLIDQVKNRVRPEVWNYIKDKVHLYIHPSRNLGYAKACNEGIIHGLRWGTQYICLSNDDVEIVDSRWLDGIWKTFDLDQKRIAGVVPMCIRCAGWGYGVSYNPEILPYKTEYTKEDYDYLLNGDFTDNPMKLPKTYPRKVSGTVVDGAVFVMPYFKREIFEEVGLFDERYFPGSGEDMDFCARAYQKGYRIVSTSHSWIWHHWSKSKDLFASGELEDPYYKPLDHPYWNDENKLWPNGFDVWGMDKDKNPYPRVKEVFTDQI